MWIESWKRVGLKTAVAAVSFLCVAAIAWVDLITRYETAVSLLYLVPLYLAAWFSWGGAAVIIGALGGLSDTMLTGMTGQQVGAVTILNSAIQGVFFVVFVAVLLALKRSRGRLEEFSRTDPLTGLANSRSFFQAGTAEMHRAARYHHPFSLVYMDMDDFKSVNDSLGHEAGDTFLRRIADTIRRTTRRSDIPARIGGDEFAILLPETDAPAAKIMVERLQAMLAKMRMPDGREATFSIGIMTRPATLPAHEYDGSIAEMVKAADALMYEAKRAGKDACRTGTFTA